MNDLLMFIIATCLPTVAFVIYTEKEIKKLERRSAKYKKDKNE